MLNGFCHHLPPLLDTTIDGNLLYLSFNFSLCLNSHTLPKCMPGITITTHATSYPNL